jgi:hypothetical protein
MTLLLFMFSMLLYKTLPILEGVTNQEEWDNMRTDVY